MEGKNNDRLHGNTTRNLFAIMIIAAVIMAGPAAPVFGAQAAKTVTVSMPAYPVIVNGVKIDIAKSKYPFIVYDNITYFPITYRDCRFLGLETQWKGDAEGLAVEKTDITAAYLPYASSATNRGRYTATVATFPITVNGSPVNNGEQQYPLLLFRDVTYFPMTWEFGVDAFGWDYNFSPAGGLVINSDNIKLEQTGFGGNAILKDDEG
ncbi:MAG: hypothetical protein LBK57_06335, partial [Clostridiales Family XIII bacterium]|nr:hypothetical protein [Clostridiales Family XIII bacterium]